MVMVGFLDPLLESIISHLSPNPSLLLTVLDIFIGESSAGVIGVIYHICRARARGTSLVHFNLYSMLEVPGPP